MFKQVFTGLTALLMAAATTAQPARFADGTHYQSLAAPQPTANADKVEIIEAFSYACPACAAFEPFIVPWHEKQADNVEFIRLPVSFYPAWQPYARAYYAAEVLGIADQSHGPMFDALHKQRKRFRSMDDIAEFYTQFGVSKDDFLKTAESFAVDTRMRRGEAMLRRYEVSSTPTMIVNGKYRATTASAGSGAALIDLLNFLVGQEATSLNAEADATEEAETAATADAG